MEIEIEKEKQYKILGKLEFLTKALHEIVYEVNAIPIKVIDIRTLDKMGIEAIGCKSYAESLYQILLQFIKS